MSSQTKLEFLVSCRVNQAYPDLRLCILKKNTDLKCKTNHHSAQFNSALAAIALSCTSFGYRLLMLAENSERDGKTPIGRLNWVMLLFGEFHY